MSSFDPTPKLDSRPATRFDAVTLDPASVLRVLIVDDERSVRKMLTVMLEQAGISHQTAASAEEALGYLTSETFDAVISDLQMSGMSGMELLAQVRRAHPHLAFLMATGVDDVRVGIQAMREGADDYLVKPLHMDAVTISLERAVQRKRLELEVEDYRRGLEQMVAERTQQLQNALQLVERSYGETLQALGEAIDLRDSETAGHSRRVSLYSIKILNGIGGSEHQLRNIAMGAWLHDIGKLAIPDAILLKPGSLVPEEWRIMQQHSQIGYDLVKQISFLAEAAEIVLMHHERFDGSGYPLGLKGRQIPLGARIFAISDTVDAMTSDRPYRAARPFQEAREQIERGSGKLYDPQIAGTFLHFPNETWETIRTETAARATTSAKFAGNVTSSGSEKKK
jgi:response regulator RpfG family c-di-GMP phosphodiesterase